MRGICKVCLFKVVVGMLCYPYQGFHHIFFLNPFKRKSDTAEFSFFVCLLRIVGALSIKQNKTKELEITHFELWFSLYVHSRIYFVILEHNVLTDSLNIVFFSLLSIWVNWFAKGKGTIANIYMCARRCVCRWRIVKEVKSQLLWHWNSLCNLLSC